MKSDVVLSVICLAYNHVKFIRKALDGFVMQKTNFNFEVIVHDDASTDGTTEIIREYEQKYPNVIKPIYQTENQWSKGKTMSKTFIYPLVRGKYVAFCEGDDYWIDENKLQKQVDFLDAHPDYSICFHPVHVIWEDKRYEDTIYPNEKLLKKIGELDLSNLLKRNFIQTNSIVYRWRFHKDSYNLIPDKILPADWFLHLLHAQVGKIGFLPDVMGVYRRNAGGIWTGANKTPEWFCKYGLLNINFFKAIQKQFHVSKYYDIKYFTYTTFYSAIFSNNIALINTFSNILYPSNKVYINKIKIIFLKIMKKLTYGKISDNYKSEYRALKTYLSWFKNK